MAWRFKASKYKNSNPVVPKPENLIRDLSIGSYHSHGNFIESSAAYMAFNWDMTGSNLAVLPLDAKGRQTKAKVPLIYAHSDFVTDFKFSPFDDGLLATGSNDTTIKLWRIPESGMPDGGISQPEVVLTSQPRRIETIEFHPSADSILTTSSANILVMWDLVKSQEIYSFLDHGDEVQSTSWEMSGKLIATQCKDRTLRIIDPRAKRAVDECKSHEGMKDSKVVWIADTQRLLTTGFGGDRSREIIIRDMRSLKNPQKTLTLDVSSGILIPLFDNDTNMCFLTGKGDRSIQFVEITNTEPYIIEGLKYSGEQTKGACLVPKRAMDVMQAEVNRVLQLCDSSIVPITWQVPRKTYREYHADIFPETRGLESRMGPTDWLSGANDAVPRINLDPKKRPKERLVVFQDKPLAERPAMKIAKKQSSANGSVTTNGSNGTLKEKENMFEENIRKSQSDTAKPSLSKPTSLTSKTNDTQETKSSPPKSSQQQISDDLEKSDQVNELDFAQIRKKNIFVSQDSSVEKEPAPVQTKRPPSKVFGRASKFKHLKGDVILKGKFENLKNLSRTMPAECNFVQANSDRIALPLTGPGGKIAVFETSKPGRIPDGVTPVLINGTGVLDFSFDPFDNQRLACACDDGQVRIWRIPQGGLTEPVNEPEFLYSAHQEKVQLVKFHPLAKDVLMTSAFDRTAKIWDLNDPSKEKINILGHNDSLFSAEWSKNGRYVATLCRDGKIRVFEPKSAEAHPIIEGGEVVPKKGARVTWALNDKYLIVIGFTRQSERQVSLYRANDLKEMTSLVLDVSPTILRPFFDEDSTTLFLTGKGESLVSTFEVSEDPPHFFPLSPYRPSGLHQGLAFLPKNICDVRSVEFARAFRVLDHSIEPVSFTVPRIKTAYFQDDLFPPTRVLWKPTMTAKEWFSGTRKLAPLVSLQPDGMQSLRDTTNDRVSKILSQDVATTAKPEEPTPKQKVTDIQQSMSKLLHVGGKLEQDDMEGVDSNEWDD